MRDNFIRLKFEKEQPFSFFRGYRVLKDDTGQNIILTGAKAILFQSSFQMSNGTDHNQYPYEYIFEILR